MFHAFRCVLDYWKLCAGRFGLSFSPWCNLFLARHMFMHISCILTLSFLYLVVIVLCLSLSLLDRLRMAPKRKSTLAQNPLSTGSSSSNLVPPFHVRFRDRKALQDFLENFQKHSIHPERQVILLDFSGTLLPSVIRTQGWDSLCEIPLRCPIMFIQEFYSNIHSINTSVSRLATSLRSIRIVITPDLISEILHILRVSHPDHLGC